MTDQFEQLWSETFRYVATHSPYYRELFRGLEGVPRLENVPTTDKKTLSERNLDFLCVPRDRIVETVTTSGTTANPLVWMMTDGDLRRLGANERLSFECVGLTSMDTVLIAVSMDRCFVAGLAYWLGLQEIGCNVVRSGAASPGLVHEMIQRFRPDAIVGVPSFLRLVAKRATESGVDLRSSSVSKIVCIGEPIRDPALTLNAPGRELESEWGARCFSTYGVTELANSLCECGEGCGGHLHDSQLHIEILDDDGKPVPDGEIGEVVATTFGVQAMPVIRYRTGDCAAIFREPCGCGRRTPRVGPLVGRLNQKLKFKGTTLFPSAIQSVLDEFDGVAEFVILARSEGQLSDAIEVLIAGDVSPESVRGSDSGQCQGGSHCSDCGTC